MRSATRSSKLDPPHICGSSAVRLGDIFKKHVVTAPPRESLATVATGMQAHKVGTVVVEGRRPVEIPTDWDVALGARDATPKTPAAAVMTVDVGLSPTTEIFTATRLFRDFEVRRQPIVDREGNLTGVVSVDDVLRFAGREPLNRVEGIKRQTRFK